MAKQAIADLKSQALPQEQKEKVAQKLAAQAHSASGAAILLQWGAIPPLVTTLRDGTDSGQREAAAALATLAAHGREFRKAVTQGRPVGLLVAILKGGSNKAASIPVAGSRYP